MRSHRLVAGALVFVAHCNDPTEIILDITTDVPCSTVSSHTVLVRVGTAASVDTDAGHVVTASECVGGHVGSLVIVPSSSNEAVDMTIVLGVDRGSDQCSLSLPQGCVVARRALEYVPHTPLHLPVALESACEGVACDRGQTCVNKACVDETIRQCSGVCDVANDAGMNPNPCGLDAAHLASDPKNCGRCGFDCSGGACAQGLCSLYPAGTMPIPVGPGACIAVNAKGVYFTDGNVNGIGDELTVPLQGGAPMYMSAGVPGGTFGIAADANVVYMATAYGVAQSSTQTTIIQGAASAVATDGMTVCAGIGNTVTCLPGGVVQSDPGASVVKLAMQAGIVYSTWTDGNVGKAAVDASGASFLVASQPSPNGIAIDVVGSREVFAVTGAVLGLTEPSTLATFAGIPQPRGVTFDHTTQALYAADGTGTIWSKLGSTLAPVATGQTSPDCLAMDATGVYWLNGSVPMKAAR